MAHAIPSSLYNYNANRARLSVLDVQIKRLQALAKQLECDVSYGVAVYGEEYRHAEGGRADPTERDAVRSLPEDVQQLLGDIRELTIERERTRTNVELVEQALGFLEDRDRAIVEYRAVEHMSWTKVADELCVRLDLLLTERSCRSIYLRALEKIGPFFRTAPIAE